MHSRARLLAAIAGLTGACVASSGCSREGLPIDVGSGTGGNATGAAGAGGANSVTEMPASAVFRQDQVLEYHVTISEADRLHLEEHGDDELYVPATLVVRGGSVGELDLGQVGIRHKGAYTLHHCWDEFGGVRSYAAECAKLSYKLDFTEYVPGTRLFGLKKLNLHASSGDATKLRELLAYGMFHDFGVDTSRIAPARVYVNGTFSGLFFAVEDIDGRFTKFHYPGAGDGNLYKEVWPHAGLPDSHFNDALQTNEATADVSDIQGFSRAVGSTTESTFETDMQPWVDIDALLRYIAVDRASKNWDGIMSFYSPDSPHNFYWYHDDGTESRFHLIPWDLDNTFWAFDPYMAPEQWVTADPVPDFNEIPANCDPRPVWTPDSDTSITPPGCDPLLRLLAAKHLSGVVEFGHALLAGPLTMAAMEPKLAAWEATLGPIVAEDPVVDATQWRSATLEFRNTLRRAISDFEAFLAEGYHQEVIVPPPPEPTAEQLAAPMPESGLLPGIVNNFEFIGGAASTAPVETDAWSAAGTTFSISWNTLNPVAGTADLRFDFQFARLPSAYDEWVQLVLGTANSAEQDLSAYQQISITLRADRDRSIRIRLNSPAYNDTFGGVWVEFGNDFTVGPTASTVKLRFSKSYYPDWARSVWTAGQGWTTTDAEARAIVLRRFTGLTFGPSPTTDASGEMLTATESGSLQIDNIYYQ